MDKNNNPSAFELDDFKTTGNISYVAVLRYNLLQIINAKANDNTGIYISLIDMLENMLIPYSDDKYEKGLKEIDNVRDKETKKIKPSSLSSEHDDLIDEAYEAKLKLLMLLMDRNNLLLDKETPGFET